jgi:hypothetical protein
MGVIHHRPMPSWHSMKLVLLLACGTLGVILHPVAPTAWGHCGSYVFWSGSGRIDVATYAGRPFGRGLLRDEVPAQLAIQAVSLLELQREARDAREAGYYAREAGYQWSPHRQPPHLPCQGPTCGARPLPLESLPLSLPVSSSGDHGLNARPIPFPESISESFRGELRCEGPRGDWPRLVRPPDLRGI